MSDYRPPVFHQSRLYSPQEWDAAIAEAVGMERHKKARVVETMGKALDEVSAERDRLAARLAEVEGKLETAEGEAYYWRSLCSEDDRVEQLQRRLAEVEAERDEAWKFAQERIEKQNVETGKRVDLIHEREAFRAERDRLAQERDFARAQVTGTLKDRNDGLALLWHCRDVFAGECELDDDWFDGFLARFPVKEGDET